MAVQWGGPADVYVVRDRHGKVVYVGMTGELKPRLAAHKNRSTWWDDTNTVTVESFDKRRDAERHEARLIDQLKPQYNLVNWEIWHDREDEIIDMSRRGMKYRQIQDATGVPANTMHGILSRARHQGVLPPIGPG